MAAVSKKYSAELIERKFVYGIGTIHNDNERLRGIWLVRRRKGYRVP
jgi:hypothetical protein